MGGKKKIHEIIAFMRNGEAKSRSVKQKTKHHTMRHIFVHHPTGILTPNNNKECRHKYLKKTRSSDCHDDVDAVLVVVVGSADGDGFASHGAGIRATSAKF